MYRNPVPVAVALVPVLRIDGTRGLLGIQRGNGVGAGGLAFPGGYVDENESAETAAARELEEETGLLIPATAWQLFASRVTPQNRLLLFTRSFTRIPEQAVMALTPTDEARGFAVLGMASELVFPTHQEIMRQELAAIGH